MQARRHAQRTAQTLLQFYVTYMEVCVLRGAAVGAVAAAERNLQCRAFPEVGSSVLGLRIGLRYLRRRGQGQDACWRQSGS